MRKTLLTMVLVAFAINVSAQEKTTKWYDNIKFSGYGMVQYQASDQEDAESNAFNLRLVRLSLEGRVHQDFYWKTQMQINGNTYDPDKSKTDIRLVDIFGEWQKYEFFKVKAGQFKRPFTFENPMHPSRRALCLTHRTLRNLQDSPTERENMAPTAETSACRFRATS